MLKRICVCNRCGKEVQESEAKIILFRNSKNERNWEKNNRKPMFLIMNNFFGFLNAQFQKDYCPECVEKIKEFMKPEKPESEGEES